jgi:hypothetical protein
MNIASLIFWQDEQYKGKKELNAFFLSWPKDKTGLSIHLDYTSSPSYRENTF